MKWLQRMDLPPTDFVTTRLVGTEQTTARTVLWIVVLVGVGVAALASYLVDGLSRVALAGAAAVLWALAFAIAATASLAAERRLAAIRDDLLFTADHPLSSRPVLSRRARIMAMITGPVIVGIWTVSVVIALGIGSASTTAWLACGLSVLSLAIWLAIRRWALTAVQRSPVLAIDPRSYDLDLWLRRNRAEPNLMTLPPLLVFNAVGRVDGLPDGLGVIAAVGSIVSILGIFALPFLGLVSFSALFRPIPHAAHDDLGVPFGYRGGPLPTTSER